MDRASNLYVSGKTRGAAAAGVDVCAQQRPESSFCSREWAGLGVVSHTQLPLPGPLVVLAAF